MAETKPESAGGPGRGRGPGGPAGMMGGHGMIGSGAKSKDFRVSGRRLLGLLKPRRAMIAFVVTLALVSVVLSTLGPKILGGATNELFSGLMSQILTEQVAKTLPPGVPVESVTKDQLISGMRARGQATDADMLANMDVK
ncbi:MAG: ABC transporter ATP-binding protein, partial [Actinobacteria bacterium]